MKTRNSQTKQLTVPSRMIQSHSVGTKMPQADGMKSWCRLDTTISTRSIHMPRLTTRLRANSSATLRRARRHHSSCGTSTLQAIIDQYTGA